jgi:hypothetical protein
MINTSDGATDYAIYEDHKLCGCSLHSTHPLSGADSLECRQLPIQSAEQVLLFGSEDQVVLKDVGVAGKIPYFASVGYLTDVSGKKLPGSEILAALPVDLTALGETFKWPPAQSKPFGELPVDATNVSVGFARNSFDFGDGNSIVSVGAAVPKFLQLQGGAAMFWVTSCQLITQGTGRYAGARGIQSFSGSSYFSYWPASPQGQVGLLVKGFRAKIFRCIKVVLKESQGA